MKALGRTEVILRLPASPRDHCEGCRLSFPSISNELISEKLPESGAVRFVFSDVNAQNILSDERRQTI